MREFLSPEQVGNADQLTIKAGVAGIDLMEAAGTAVADVLSDKFRDVRRILIVCGIGNNGGDGFIAARLLAQSGIMVDVHVVGAINRIGGDAALAFNRLGSSTNLSVIEELNLQHYELVVDALFGAGLDREVRGKAGELVRAINDCDVPVLSVDLPSGIDGASGRILGIALKANVTVTFFRAKPGHVLYPGRQYCGDVVVRQIGIRPWVLEHTGIAATSNQPELWRCQFPVHTPDDNKYTKGHTLVVSGPLPMSGASRLAALAALRSGSGLVTIAGTKQVVAANAAQLTSIMLCEAQSSDELDTVLADTRINCVIIGPGMTPDAATRARVSKLLSLQRHCVLDAGALSAFAEDSSALFSNIKSAECSVVLTPHEGEFSRLFAEQSTLASKIDRAQAAADKSGAVIVLKGPDTVVASPQNIACIADNAPPWLATAGSGDVLAGVIGGFLAQGMPAFEAAAAAVWINGDAANRLGPPLVSSDLDEGLRLSLSEIMRFD